jgi:hypothetical protein
VAEFIVEVYVSSARLAAVDALFEAATAAASDVSRDGESVHCTRSFVVPEDETCFLLFEAASIGAVRDAVGRANLGTTRINETRMVPDIRS